MIIKINVLEINDETIKKGRMFKITKIVRHL